MTVEEAPLARKKVICFEDLDVYQRAFALSLNIHKASLTFPQIEQFALANQIRRASKSICANIAEGYGKQKMFPSEFRRFVAIALGSSDELRVWIRYCEALNYIDSATGQYWLEEAARLSRMLQALLNKLN